MAACNRCGLTHQCICDKIPAICPPWQLVLLTHPNELSRDTNSGRWLKESLEGCEVVVWDRVNPPEALLSKISSSRFEPLLLCPDESSQAISTQLSGSDEKTPLVIILDATWQEARKMLNRSEWLKALPRNHLEPGRDSGYSLRRNQQQGHLCTCEVGIELLRLSGQTAQAENLSGFFEYSLKAFQADKSGHALKG